jgi:hypothetical protein
MQCAITRRFRFPPISFSEALSLAATEELRDGTCQLQAVSSCSKVPDTKRKIDEEEEGNRLRSCAVFQFVQKPGWW